MPVGIQNKETLRTFFKVAGSELSFDFAIVRVSQKNESDVKLLQDLAGCILHPGKKDPDTGLVRRYFSEGSMLRVLKEIPEKG